MRVIPLKQPNEKLIKVLESVLQDAKDGTIVGIAAVGEMKDGRFAEITCGVDSQPVLYLGFLQVITKHIVDHYLEIKETRC